MIDRNIEIAYLDTDKLIPYSANAKTHPDEQIERIANSIREFGFKTPIVVDANFELIQGHGRLLASQSLKLKKVPCIIAEDLSEDQVKMLRLADNKVAESEWDYDLMGSELDTLSDIFQVEDFGFILTEEQSDTVDDLSGEAGESYEIIVTLDSEVDQESLYYKLIEEGYKCRTSTL